MRLRSQMIPKSRVVHLAEKQILKRHILSSPKITVSKNLQGRVSIPGQWTISGTKAWSEVDNKGAGEVTFDDGTSRSQ